MKKNIFISTPNSKQIEFWQIKKNKKLKLIQIIPTNGLSQPLQYNCINNLLYVGTQIENKIIIFHLKKNNNLKLIQKYSLFNKPNHISFNRDKTLLFCASYHGNGFTMHNLNKDGTIKDTHIIRNILGCHSTNIDHTNTILCVTSLKKDCIYIYQVKKNKKNIFQIIHKNIIHTLNNSGPRHIIFHPIVNIIYNINEFHGTIDVWYLNYKTISIKWIQTISIIPKQYKQKPWSSEIKIHPNCLFLYACDRKNNIISLFYINQINYSLKLCMTYKTELQPRSFHISLDGKILIIVGQISNSMSIYEINIKTGFLNIQQKIKVGKGPLWIHIT